MASKGDVRPIYQELQGDLSQAPEVEKIHVDVSYDDQLWGRVNAAIVESGEITKTDTYTRFKIVPDGRVGNQFVMLATFRTALGGIIDRLHADFFSDEERPFSGGPTQVITQQQTQDQTTDVRVTMVLEIQSKIDERLLDSDTPEEEEKFLEKLKPGLATAKSAVELVQLILTTAKSAGIDLDSLSQLFSRSSKGVDVAHCNLTG